jgi:membrane-associated phospholipid phosphatase
VAVAGALVWKLTGSPLVFVVGVPLMIWSRLVLRRHTPAQTLAGSILGVLLVVLFFDLFAGAV